jgi:hypothetical protein
MKRFKITWEYIQKGTSYIEAKTLDDAIFEAPESVTDFGDPEEFTQDVQWDTGWEVKTVEEVTEE